ncbi:MAG: carbohydrate ABC transporter permease [Candidatus Margulisbacteria bacterium]|jgi:multiple sugar transport system permease protein|nr:carbohydrate ABC transporter permease [Candidatus Margulisiibacteriota bacterium]
MWQFWRDLRAMPFHVYKKVMDRVYNVLMYTTLLVVLFPIFWMVFNAFMNNNDIVQGKIFFQRAPTNVLFTEKVGDKLLLGTRDGSINYLALDTGKLLQRRRFKTNNTNFASDDKYVWLSSADKGLIRVDKETFAVKKARVKWNAKLDFNKISKTLLAVDAQNNKLWLTLGYLDYDQIFEFDRETMQLRGAYRILSQMPDFFDKFSIGNIYYHGGRLYAATNLGVVVINAADLRQEKIIEHPDFENSDIRYLAYDVATDTLFMNSFSKVYAYQDGALRQIYSTADLDYFVQIGYMTVSDTGLILGTGNGFTRLTKTGQHLEDVTAPLFDNVNKKGKLINKGVYVNSDVNYAQALGERVYVSTSVGRAALYNLQTKEVEKTYLMDKAGYFNVFWRNFIDLFYNIDFGLYVRNSFIICGVTAFFSMILATITAYALVRFKFPGNRFLSTAVLSTQMIPGVMMLIPVYIMFIKITEATGIPMKGTVAGLVFVYAAFFLPFSIWILRGFFASIPLALEEAATLDGCTPFQIFYKISLPLSMPGIVATGIYIFLQAWDELVFAWVLTSAHTMTIPVGIRLFVGNFQNRYDLLMAASTVATIPVMVMFILLQKQIVSGLTSGAVKD